MWKVIIVGLGRIGMGYDYHLNPKDYILTHAQAFQTHPLFDLIAGVDTDKKSRDKFTQKFNRPAFDNLTLALKMMKPDILVIALPTHLHGEMIRIALQDINPIAILCEKPISYNLEEARDITNRCHAKNCQLYVNYMRRSDPAVIEIKKRVDSSLINAPIKGNVWYSKGLFHNGSHFLNLLQYWLGEVIQFQIINTGTWWDDIDPEPDVQITFAQGKVVFLSLSEKNFSHCTIELLASNGRLFYARSGENITWQAVAADTIFKGYARLHTLEETIPTAIGYQSQYHVAEQLALSLEGKQAEICKGTQALQTLECLSTIRNKL